MKVEIVGEGGGSIRDAEMTWVDKKLGELAKICTGKLDANASSENGKYPFFTCARQPLRINSYSYDGECVLVAGNGDLNVKYYEGKFDAYQRTYIIKVRPELRDSLSLGYVYHFLETYLETLRKQSIGGIIKYIKLGNLTKAPIPLPPISEQKRIAKILNAADALRAKRREALAQLDTLLQSTFLNMFGDPVANPMGWKMGRLADIVERLDGGKNVAQSETKTDYRVLKVSAVTYGVYRPEESKYLPADFNVPESYIVKSGDLLISRANTTELIGATAYVWETPERIALPDKIWKFIWKNDAQIEPLFIYHLSQHIEFRRILASRASGTSGSMKNIAKSKLLSLPVPLPPSLSNTASPP